MIEKFKQRNQKLDERAIELNEIKKNINQLEYLDLLDLIEILLLKKQLLKKSKRQYFLSCQKLVVIKEEFEMIQSENFRIKIEAIIERLRKFQEELN